jgi:AcrR family transcriptional regulator
MATPRKKKTEEKILKAALSLFVRKGYNGTSVDEITRMAELTKGALYGHFSSKAQLVLRLIKDFKSNIVQEIIAATERENLSAVEKLHKITSLKAQFALQNQSLCILPTLLTHELNEHEIFKTALKEVYLEYRANIAKIIEQGQREGAFEKDLDPDLTALSFTSFHDGVLHQWILNQDRIDGKEFLRTFRKMVFQGILSTSTDASK